MRNDFTCSLEFSLVHLVHVEGALNSCSMLFFLRVNTVGYFVFMTLSCSQGEVHLTYTVLFQRMSSRAFCYMYAVQLFTFTRLFNVASRPYK